MAQKLLQHKHCIRCGLAIKSDDDFCSDECKDTHAMILKKKRRQLLTLYVGSVVVVIILVLMSMGGA